MKLLFKISGFCLIIFTTTAIGFFKANSLNLRHKKLCSIHNGIANLKEHIRLHSGELDRLLKISFESYPISYIGLQKEECVLIDDFFQNIGMSDTTAEYERCELYMSLIKSKADEVKNQYKELNRLYKSLGFLSGLFICIFFL